MTETAERAAVRRQLDAIKPYLSAFVAQYQRGTDDRRGSSDVAALLKTFLREWEETFSQLLPSVARSYVHELIDIRNRWAHEQPFTRMESERAVDTARQLAYLIGAPALETTIAPGSPQDMPTGAITFSSIGGSQRWSGQREIMREIYARVGGNESRAIAEYAAAERAGIVQRKNNRSGLTPEAYARALLADGYKKGWLK